MPSLSNVIAPAALRNTVTIGGTGGTQLQRCTIDTSTGAVSAAGTGGTDLQVAGSLTATKVWNAVYNDYADFQRLNDKLEYGKCYYDTLEGARICTQRCQKSVIGIASDTFGMSVGSNRYASEVPIAVSGWVLAFVDKQYEPGTPLTCDSNGSLIEMNLQEKRDYPERLVAIYKGPEYDEYFSVHGHKIKVNGRHWVKVK